MSNITKLATTFNPVSFDAHKNYKYNFSVPDNLEKDLSAMFGVTGAKENIITHLLCEFEAHLRIMYDIQVKYKTDITNFL